MKKIRWLLAGALFITSAAKAQMDSTLLTKNSQYTGATTTKKCNVIFQLDTNDPKRIEKAFRNINNALNDPRMKGNIQIELIAFAAGTDAYLKGSNYENDLKSLVEKGVIVAQCNNTLKERKISRDQIYDFIGVVPSGVGELIIRQTEGWAIVKP